MKYLSNGSVAENDTHSTECRAGYDVGIIQLHKMKQIIIQERKTEFKNSEVTESWMITCIYKSILE